MYGTNKLGSIFGTSRLIWDSWQRYSEVTQIYLHRLFIAAQRDMDAFKLQ